MQVNEGKAIEILLVDDNPGDLQLLLELLSEAKHPNHASSVLSGRAALMFMRKEGVFKDAPSPDLLVLDINMPGMSGIDVLREVRSDPLLHRLPVIILTSSDAEGDIRRCYDLQASCYVSKPGELEGLGQVVRSIDDFWLTSVRYPRCGEGPLPPSD